MEFPVLKLLNVRTLSGELSAHSTSGVIFVSVFKLGRFSLR